MIVFSAMAPDPLTLTLTLACLRLRRIRQGTIQPQYLTGPKTKPRFLLRLLYCTEDVFHQKYPLQPLIPIPSWSTFLPILPPPEDRRLRLPKSYVLPCTVRGVVAEQVGDQHGRRLGSYRLFSSHTGRVSSAMA